MKIITVISLLLICSTCFANEIDKLNTNNEVESFLETRVNPHYKNDHMLGPRQGNLKASEYGQNRFFKLDFDLNGQTDLIIDGARLIVVLDSGESKYEIHELSTGAFFENHVRLIQIDSLGSPRKLIIQQDRKPGDDLDTLVFAFQNFIEYNPQPEKGLRFESINIETSPCFGECPVFEMAINKDRSASFDAKEFNDKKGKFRGVISEKDLPQLIALLSYLKIGTLKDRYQVRWSDDQTVTVRIRYDGKTKNISDYGEIGTYGLTALYKRFFDFRKQIAWENL